MKKWIWVYVLSFFAVVSGYYWYADESSFSAFVAGLLVSALFVEILDVISAQ